VKPAAHDCTVLYRPALEAPSKSTEDR